MIGSFPHMQAALTDVAASLAWAIGKAVLLAAIVVLVGGYVLWRGRRS